MKNLNTIKASINPIPALSFEVVKVMAPDGSVVALTVLSSDIRNGNIVPFFNIDTGEYVTDHGKPVYIYRTHPFVSRVFFKDGTVAYTYYDGKVRENFPKIVTWNYDDDTYEAAYSEADNNLLLVSFNLSRDRGVFEYYMMESEVEEHPETWVHCETCERWVHHSLIDDDGCVYCAEDLKEDFN